MTRPLILVASLLLAGSVAAADSDSPHHMTKPDGSLDDDKCTVCHDESLALSLPKAETCTMCHSETEHGGSYIHLHAKAARVAELMPAGDQALPVADDGRLYCGTCHLFHDPAVGGDELLASAWVPRRTGLSGAVRAGLESSAHRLAEKHEQPTSDTAFAAGTRALRLPVDKGQLCAHCHRDRQ